MNKFKKYKCSRCGFVKEIDTNHYGPCWSIGHFNCCPACPPWAKYPEFGGRTVWECMEVKNERLSSAAVRLTLGTKKRRRPR